MKTAETAASSKKEKSQFPSKNQEKNVQGKGSGCPSNGEGDDEKGKSFGGIEVN